MKTIYLIGCCYEKLDRKAAARDLYISRGFKVRLAYAESKNPDAIYVLSGKHHLVKLDKEIAPYDLNLDEQTAEYRHDWNERIVDDLSLVSDLREDKYVILAGKTYYEDIVSHMDKFEIPLASLEHTEAIKWLEENTNTCSSASQKFDINDFKNISAMTYAAKHRMLTTGDTILFEDLFQRFPNDGMVHYRMAECLEQQGAYSEASEEYEKAGKLFPIPKYKEMARQGKNRCFAMMGGTNA